MTKREKRLRKIRQNPKNVSFDELRQVLEDFGFILERSSGSHHSFRVRISDENRLLVIPYQRPVKSNYVKDAITLIDEILEQEIEQPPQNEDSESGEDNDPSADTQ